MPNRDGTWAEARLQRRVPAHGRLKRASSRGGSSAAGRCLRMGSPSDVRAKPGGQEASRRLKRTHSRQWMPGFQSCPGREVTQVARLPRSRGCPGRQVAQAARLTRSRAARRARTPQQRRRTRPTRTLHARSPNSRRRHSCSVERPRRQRLERPEGFGRRTQSPRERRRGPSQRNAPSVELDGLRALPQRSVDRPCRLDTQLEHESK